MKTVFMTVGLPASGKSTWARAKMAEHPGSYKRVNKDEIRAMIDDGKWSRDNEKFVLGVRDYVVAAALNAGKHVIGKWALADIKSHAEDLFASIKEARDKSTLPAEPDRAGAEKLLVCILRDHLATY